MSSNFVTFTEDDFVQALLELPELGCKIKQAPGQYGQEYVVDLIFDDLPDTHYIRIFSSVDVRTGVSREKGSDAIRVTSVIQGRVFGTRRIHRTTGWQARLRVRVWRMYDNLRAACAVESYRNQCSICGNAGLVSLSPPLCSYHAEFLSSGEVLTATFSSEIIEDKESF